MSIGQTTQPAGLLLDLPSYSFRLKVDKWGMLQLAKIGALNGTAGSRINQMAADRAAVLTPNHWEAVLMQTLAADDDFTDHIFN